MVTARPGADPRPAGDRGLRRVAGFRIRRARRADLPAVAALFAAAFPESLRRVFDRPPGPELVEEAFRICWEAEPRAFWVAEREQPPREVAGYVFAPLRLGHLWRRALCGGYLWRWTWRWLRGAVPLGARAAKALLADKGGFLRSALDPRFAAPARILSIAVRPNQHGHGIGSALLATGLRRFDRAGVAARLEVRPDNAPALRMYEAAGFRAVGTTSDSHGPWLIMIRRPRA